MDSFEGEEEDFDDEFDGPKQESINGINQGRWQKDEHALFLEGLEKYGREWKKIQALIKTRTVVQIRTHAQKYFQKLAKSGSTTSAASSSSSLAPASSFTQHFSGGARGGSQTSLRGFGSLGGDRTPPPPEMDAIDSSSSSPQRKILKLSSSHYASSAVGGGGSSSSTSAVSTAASGTGGTTMTTRNNSNNHHFTSHQNPHHHHHHHEAGRHRKSSDAEISASVGGVTPRTMAAATILLGPRLKEGPNADWIARNQAYAASVLSPKRRTSPRFSFGNTWESAVPAGGGSQPSSSSSSTSAIGGSSSSSLGMETLELLPPDSFSHGGGEGEDVALDTRGTIVPTSTSNSTTTTTTTTMAHAIPGSLVSTPSPPPLTLDAPSSSSGSTPGDVVDVPGRGGGELT